MNGFDHSACLSRAKRELAADVLSEFVPRGVRSLSAVHVHVDGNYYGGAFDPGALDGEPSIGFWNRVHAALDRWIADGGLRAELLKHCYLMLRNWYNNMSAHVALEVARAVLNGDGTIEPGVVDAYRSLR